jgi:hypothetical protein
MKFYGNGIIWDAVKNKTLCKFEKGILETEDSYICNRLKELKYKNDEEFDVYLLEENVEKVDRPDETNIEIDGGELAEVIHKHNEKQIKKQVEKPSTKVKRKR